MPPSAKSGQYFVNDPSMTDTSEVKGRKTVEITVGLFIFRGHSILSKLTFIYPYFSR